MKSNKILLGVILLVSLWSFAAADSYQMYMKIEGIDGDSSFQGVGGWISVMTWEWGETRSGSMHNPIITVTQSKYTGPKMESVGSLDGLGIQFTTGVDKSSAALLSFFEKKIKIPSAKLCLLSVVDDKETVLTYDLKDVMVTNHAQKEKSETFTFNYGKIRWSQK
jgi:type VI protein secretion system component Hcp